MAAAAEGTLPTPVIRAAVEAVAPAGQALRQLALALAADPGALAKGAPPVAGRLAAGLIARGSAALAVPACADCGRTGKPLTRGDDGAGVPAVPVLAARRRLRQVRQGPPARREGRRRAGPPRGVLPQPRPEAPPHLRQVRQERVGRGPRPGRTPGRLRELLQDAHRHLQHRRQA